MSDDDVVSGKHPDDHDRVVSPYSPERLAQSAFDVHVHAITRAKELGTPTFVADEHLVLLSTEPLLAAEALCKVGLWERMRGGFRIVDPIVNDLVELRRRLDETIGRMEADCVHRWIQSTGRRICEDCGESTD